MVFIDLSIKLIYFIMLSLKFVIAQSIVTDYSVQNVLTGKTCSNVVFTKDGVSAVHCVTLCGQHTNCKSIFYERDVMRCIGCDVLYAGGDVTSWPNDEGGGAEYFGPYAAYGQNCSDSNKPCIENNTVCFSGLDVCVCDPAKNYDPGSGSCVDDCTTWGDTYQRYPRWVVMGWDHLVHGSQFDVLTCLHFCHNHSFTTTCYGVDYDFVNGICYYNNQYAGTLPGSWVVSGIFDSYVRNCA